MSILKLTLDHPITLLVDDVAEVPGKFGPQMAFHSGDDTLYMSLETAKRQLDFIGISDPTGLTFKFFKVEKGDKTYINIEQVQNGTPPVTVAQPVKTLPINTKPATVVPGAFDLSLYKAVTSEVMAEIVPMYAEIDSNYNVELAESDNTGLRHYRKFRQSGDRRRFRDSRAHIAISGRRDAWARPCGPYFVDRHYPESCGPWNETTPGIERGERWRRFNGVGTDGNGQDNQYVPSAGQQDIVNVLRDGVAKWHARGEFMADQIHWNSPGFGEAFREIEACMENTAGTSDGVCDTVPDPDICSAGIIGNVCSTNADCQLYSCAF